MITRIRRCPDATVAYIIAGAAAALLLLSLIPYLHGFWWAFELPSHFRPHIAAVSTTLGIIALILKSWRTSALALFAAAICLTPVLTVPTILPFDNSGVVVVSQNLSLENGSVDEALRVLIDEDPDIVVLQEYTPEWHESLKSVADRYLTTITVPRNGGFGMAVFSKLPVRSHEILALGDTEAPAIVMEIDTPLVKAHLVAIHFQPPMRGHWSKDRNRQLNELKHYLLGLNGPYVVVGDFNCTPFSPSLRAFIRETQTRLGQSIWLPTWPSVFGWAGIPIDLALGSEGVKIGSMFRIDPIGSDHRGIRFSVTTQL